ncbi:MAG: hypothetical protein JWN40_3733 [Phycisphaerales bacterium]|nr:hypothetical protein [Phycisphaerales bacterium]
MRVVSGGVLAVLLALTLAKPAAGATPAEVEAAIQKGVKYLYSAQVAGLWDPASPAKAIKPIHWGGETALATYALLAAGESRQDPKLAKAIDFSTTVNMDGIYSLGLRAQIWHYLPQSREVRAGIKRDGDNLLASLKKEGTPKGMFNYPVNDKATRYDHSVSQYGVLGMWAVAQLGYEVPTSAWKMIDTAWRSHQDNAGAWEYVYGKGEARASMTAAGVATLFITQDYLNMAKGADCVGNIRDSAIDRGFRWMIENLKDVEGRRTYYTLYGIERIGVASGYKYFGTLDWYDDGAEYLVRSQGANGGWGTGVADTCFAILFLVRGRAPVVMNKLEYDIDTAGDKPKPGNWNQRPRDCANLVRWMGRQLERDLNWQIVNLKVPVDDLHDAPILYIAGNQAISFSEAEEKKLRQFVVQGGMIVGNADCAQPAFALAFQKLGQKLFPAYEFRDLPDNHLIMTTPYHFSKWKNKPAIKSLSNGARELMVLISAGDFSRLWQLNTYAGREEGHEFLWNLYFYAVDKSNMRVKGQTYIVHPSKQVTAAREIAVARLEYAGNWNPEPGGWRRLNAVMHNHNQTDLAMKGVKLGSGELGKGEYKVAHLTGTDKFRLTPEAGEEVRKFVEGGGTLIVDSCGGGTDFAAAAEEQILALFPGAKMDLLAPDHPVFSAGGKTAEVSYRAFAKRVVGNARTPRIKGIEVNKRVGVFFSVEDLSEGLVGQAVDGIFGYEPASATELMRNIVMFAGGGGKAKEAAAVVKPAPKK